MLKNSVVKLAGRDTISDPLTESLRTGADQLGYRAVEEELLELLEELRSDEQRTARQEWCATAIYLINEAAVALANKMARTAWVLLDRNETYCPAHPV